MDRLQSTLTEARTAAERAARRQRAARRELDGIPAALQATKRAAAVAAAAVRTPPHRRGRIA